MDVTATLAQRNTRYTAKTKLLTVRFPLPLVEKLNASGNASALIVEATAKALGMEEPATTERAAPAF